MFLIPEEIVSVFTAQSGLYIVLLALLSIVSYVITGVSLFEIGRSLRIKNCGLAWAPVLKIWLVGAIADKFDSQNGESHKFRWVLVGLTAAYIVFLAAIDLEVVFRMAQIPAGFVRESQVELKTSLFGTGFFSQLPMVLAGVLLTVITYICCFKIYELCKPEKAVKYLLISILVPFAFPFVLLSCKNALGEKREITSPESSETDV